MSKLKKFLGANELICTKTHETRYNGKTINFVESQKYNCKVEVINISTTKVIFVFLKNEHREMIFNDMFDTDYLLNNFNTIPEHRKLMVKKLLPWYDRFKIWNIK